MRVRGYLGADFQSFFSAVASGAAGSYFVTLTSDAGISTDLTIQPGQDVHITTMVQNGKHWGNGSFTVQQGGTLSLVGVVLTGELTVQGGGGASVSGGTLGYYAGNVEISPSTTLTLNLQCYQQYITLSDVWRGTSQAGGRRSDQGHNDGTGYQPTGVGGGRWYRFVGPSGDALPLAPPGNEHCGTSISGWLSGCDASPSDSCSTLGRYPEEAEGVVERTACFQAGNSYHCRYHAVVGVVRCGDFLLWRLPYAPCEHLVNTCGTGYCTMPSDF